ncbi:thioesterase family protein [Nocardia rhamnosiphila]|uniref:Thioesterase family protein n=1 Tax=Nocardia rhamnosiphila TaxID=426716 RepID=A0ABV2WM71_9NOCA|nr:MULTISPECIES: thioesterase family protein [Nocardia]MCX0273276.1 thioesterase family protein [Nocardia zapadnayensis]
MSDGLPTPDQLTALPGTVTGTVTAETLDGGDHMNVVQYLRWGTEGADALVRAVGIDDTYRAERKMGLFTARHHLSYTSELREGDRFAVAGRILDRGAKAVHMMTFLVDTGRGRIANTLEILLVHVDLRHRRAVELPADIADSLDEHIARSRALPWQAPLCGAIGIRR